MPGGMSGKKQNLSVGLSVCLYHHSGQTGRWISLKLGIPVGTRAVQVTEMFG